jgi:hypothetical protein
MLYSFENLRKLLDEIAPAKDIIRKKYLVVEGETINTQKVEDKTVRLEKDGIYAVFNGERFRRYLYMQNYDIKNYKRFPVAHLIQCSKVKNIGKDYYTLASTATVSVIDRESGVVHEDKVLSICSICIKEIKKSKDIPTNTKKFFETLIVNSNQPKDTDIFGYTFDWDEISRRYRASKNYTCEKCGIKITEEIDYRYLHVHHKDGNKVHNHPNNLQCLCVLCHSKVDDHHANNFAKPRFKHQIDSFIAKYGNRD